MLFAVKCIISNFAPLNLYSYRIGKVMKTKIILALFVALCSSGLSAQQVLTLEQCREKALEANKGLKMSEEKRVETENLQKVALWQMLPKVGATGGYTWMDKSVSLLSASTIWETMCRTALTKPSAKKRATCPSEAS